MPLAVRHLKAGQEQGRQLFPSPFHQLAAQGSGDPSHGSFFTTISVH
jgi:hypothetical protein